MDSGTKMKSFGVDAEWIPGEDALNNFLGPISALREFYLRPNTENSLYNFTTYEPFRK